MLILILAVLCIPVLVYAGVCLAVCICALKPAGAERADCLIVLGARVRPDGSLSNTLRKRCNAALMAQKQGIARHIILCGGIGADEPVAEAIAMREYLLLQGASGDTLWLDAASANTVENLRNAKEIMRQNGWRTAAVVTSDYHVRRALWIARDLKIPAAGVACASPDLPSHWIKSRLQETVSWFLYFVRKI